MYSYSAIIDKERVAVEIIDTPSIRNVRYVFFLILCELIGKMFIQTYMFICFVYVDRPRNGSGNERSREEHAECGRFYTDVLGHGQRQFRGLLSTAITNKPQQIGHSSMVASQ